MGQDLQDDLRVLRLDGEHVYSTKKGDDPSIYCIYIYKKLDFSSYLLEHMNQGYRVNSR